MVPERAVSACAFRPPVARGAARQGACKGRRRKEAEGRGPQNGAGPCCSDVSSAEAEQVPPAPHTGLQSPGRARSPRLRASAGVRQLGCFHHTSASCGCGEGAAGRSPVTWYGCDFPGGQTVFNGLSTCYRCMVHVRPLRWCEGRPGAIAGPSVPAVWMTCAGFVPGSEAGYGGRHHARGCTTFGGPGSERKEGR